LAHLVADQLRFARSEWLRGLRGVTEADAARHFGRMNCISWIVGHLTWQEQRYLLWRSRDIVMFPEFQTDFAFGAPMSTPSLAAMRKAWTAVTKNSEPFLDSLKTKDLMKDLPLNGKPSGQTLADAIRRMTFHYWYHIGEIQAIRQMLGQQRLPQYVGNLEAKAPYRPEK
jgi:DinB superfamily